MSGDFSIQREGYASGTGPPLWMDGQMLGAFTTVVDDRTGKRIFDRALYGSDSCYGFKKEEFVVAVAKAMESDGLPRILHCLPHLRNTNKMTFKSDKPHIYDSEGWGSEAIDTSSFKGLEKGFIVKATSWLK